MATIVLRVPLDDVEYRKLESKVADEMGTPPPASRAEIESFVRTWIIGILPTDEIPEERHGKKSARTDRGAKTNTSQSVADVTG